MEEPRTPNEWYEREPRLEDIRDAILFKAQCSHKQEMHILRAVSQLIQKLTKPNKATSAAPAPTASKPAPKSRIERWPGQVAASAPTAPQRKPFEKALQTVCGPKPTMAKPWSLPDGAA